MGGSIATNAPRPSKRRISSSRAVICAARLALMEAPENVTAPASWGEMKLAPDATFRTALRHPAYSRVHRSHPEGAKLGPVLETIENALRSESAKLIEAE